MTPNDRKLSDRRSGRGTCRWVERWRWSAAGAVTAEPVRCSAWLGDLGMCIGIGHGESRMIADKYELVTIEEERTPNVFW